MLKIIDWKTIAAALLVVSAWAIVVVISGTGLSIGGISWDFENTGQFGDSFGSLSAIMASLAALSALATFRITQDEIERIKNREKERDRELSQEKEISRKREKILDKAARKSEFEKTFFLLMGIFSSIVSETDYTSQSKQHKDEGRDAFRKILQWFEHATRMKQDHEKAFQATLNQFPNDMFHYFRFLYHLINFVHESDTDDKYFYIRLVRSLLSDAEISLLALNCLYGEGKGRFKELVEEYALLHNISKTYKSRLKLEGKFYDRAFGQELAPARGLPETHK